MTDTAVQAAVASRTASEPRRPGWRSAAVLAALGGLYSVAHGQDINYDQFNNHAWAVWALLHPHVSLKAGVGGVSSFLPSVWNVPWYLAQQHLPGVVVGFLLGAVHGIAVWLAWAIAWEVTLETSRWPRVISCGLAATFAFLSPSVQTEFGTTFGNVTTAIPMLAALLLLLRGGPEPSAPRLAWTGLLVGLSVGAKLSNAPFAVGLAAAALVLVRRPPRLGRALGVTAAAGLLGFLLADGWWAYRLWRDVGNPFFPFFNGVFHSGYGPDSYVSDPRYGLGGPLDLLRLPFRTATPGGYPSELPGRDVRWVVLLAAAVLTLAARWPRRRVSRSPGLAVVVYGCVGYLLWAVLFDIGRYLAAVELVSGAMLLAVVERLLRASRARAVALTAAIAVVGALLVAPDFGHLGWRARWYPVASGEAGIPADSVVVFPTNDSSSWILSTLPGSVQPYQVPRVFSAQPWFPVSAPPLLDDQIAATIRSTDRPVFSVSKARNVAIARSTAGLYGRHVGADGCHEVAALVPLAVCAWEKD